MNKQSKKRIQFNMRLSSQDKKELREKSAAWGLNMPKYVLFRMKTDKILERKAAKNRETA